MNKTLTTHSLNLFLLVTAFALSPSFFVNAATPQPTREGWLVVNGSNNFSLPMTQLLLTKNVPCTLVTKTEDLILVDQYIGAHDKLTIVEADYATKEGRKALIQAGKNRQFMFLDAEHGDYATWHKAVPDIVTNSMIAAHTNKLTVFATGRVYPMGHGQTVTESSTYLANTQQGVTLKKVENIMQMMSNPNCKVRIIRTSYPFGHGMYDFLLSSTFKEMPHMGRMTWLYDVDQSYQFCYTPDAARLALLLSENDTDQAFRTINYSGYTYDSVESFGRDIHAQVNQVKRASNPPFRLRVVTKLQLEMAAALNPNANRGSDLKAFFEDPTHLVDSPCLKELNFEPTPAPQAIIETMRWYYHHPQTRTPFKLL